MLKTWLNPLWIAIWLCFCQCGAPEREASTKDALAKKAPSTEQSGQFAPAPIAVVVKTQPKPFPYKPAGLRFQSGVVSANGQRPFKPITGQAMSSTGDVALAFRHLNVVAWFPAPGYEPHLLGLPAWGGSGEPIQAPENLWLDQAGLTVHSQGNGLLSTFQLDGLLIHAKSLTGNPANRTLVPGPNGSHLVADPQRPNVYLRHVDDNTAAVQYVLPQTGEEIRANGGLRWTFAANGSVAVMRMDLGFIARYDAAGSLQHLYRLETDQIGLDIALDDDTLWLLIGDPSAAQIVALSREGSLQHYWQAPCPTNRIVKHGQQWLFVDSPKGAAVRYTP